MISTANLLVDVHRIRLEQDRIDKMIVLRMSKRFVERARCKEAFPSVMFYYVISNKCTSTNEE